MQHRKYLGLELPKNLKLNTHVSSIIGKALTITRSLPRRQKRLITEHAVVSLERPHLEYTSSVWHLYTQKQINEIKAGVQRQVDKSGYFHTPGSVCET